MLQGWRPRQHPFLSTGNGRGGFGCVAVAAPTFLSEEEARQVIADEAKKASLTFQADVKELKDVMIPATDQYWFLDEMDSKSGMPSRNPRTTQKGTLRLNGTDTGKHISYEFVSKDDFTAWEQQDLSRSCTFHEYNLIKTAEILRTGLAQSAPKETVAVFLRSGYLHRAERRKRHEESRREESPAASPGEIQGRPPQAGARFYRVAQSPRGDLACT